MQKKSHKILIKMNSILEIFLSLNMVRLH